MRAPTIPEGEEHFVAPKQNFAEVFDRMPFLGKEKVPKYHGNRCPVIVNGEQVWEEQHTTKSGVKSEFITANNLHAESSPQDWFKAFLPIHDGSAKNLHQSNNCWTHRWAMFTTTKALSMGAGVEGGIYSTFQPFSYLEIEQFIGLYILQGLNPSPKVDSKFHPNLMTPYKATTCVIMSLVAMLPSDTNSSKPFLLCKIQSRHHLHERINQHTRLIHF